MWKQRLVHWAQLTGLMIVVYAAVLGGNAGVSAITKSRHYYSIHYKVAAHCGNCQQSFWHWVPKGTLFDNKYETPCKFCGIALTGK